MANRVKVLITLEFPMKRGFDMDLAVDEMHDMVVNGFDVHRNALSQIDIEVLDEDGLVVDKSENLYQYSEELFEVDEEADDE